MYSSYNLLYKLYKEIGRLAKMWDCFIKEWVRLSICFYMLDASTKLCCVAPVNKLSDSVVADFLAVV